MKIKQKTVPYDAVMAMPRLKHKKPVKPNILFRTAVRVASMPDLWATHFSYTRDKACEPGGPYLILMNHNAFIDLKIASAVLYPKPYGIVATTDAMVGKWWLMRMIGCIPTQKFVTDMGLIRDMKYALKEKKMSVLMYPEAGYSFDGRSTALPDSLGGLVKLLGVPVLMIETHGAFARDPLYNGLRQRRVKVTADVRPLLTKETIEASDAATLNEIIRGAFAFDAFAWQAATGLRITEKTRATGLERILYKCPACMAEGRMEGLGTDLTCHACGKIWHLEENGRLQATEEETEFPHIPDWYDWERAAVRAELETGAYHLETPVRIGMMIDDKALYHVGNGQLTHDAEGFRLTGCDGKLDYTQKPITSHTLNADFFWYEIGDVIGIGNRDALYYCFPEPVEGHIPPVAKVRLAAEELYKMKMPAKRGR